MNSALVYVLTDMSGPDCSDDLIYVLTEAYVPVDSYHIHLRKYGHVEHKFTLRPERYQLCGSINMS